MTGDRLEHPSRVFAAAPTRILSVLAMVAGLLLLIGCSRSGAPVASEAGAAQFGHEVAAASLQPASLAADGRLNVVATTTLVGDAVRRVGGDHIALTVLLPVGSDPHSYVATPQDAVKLSRADVVFVNGLGLEESLLSTVASDVTAPVVSLNEDVTPLAAGEGDESAHGDESEHGALDPHSWQDPRNVARWATTVATALSRLDPAHADDYDKAGSAYAAELNALYNELAGQYAQIPEAQRSVVTDHDDLAYLANAFKIHIAGSVLPSFSTMASVSARDRSALEELIKSQDVRAVLVGTTVNPLLADQVAQDTGVAIVPVYTDSLGAPDSPAADYPSLMRANAAAIISALQ